MYPVYTLRNTLELTEESLVEFFHIYTLNRYPYGIPNRYSIECPIEYLVVSYTPYFKKYQLEYSIECHIDTPYMIAPVYLLYTLDNPL